MNQQEVNFKNPFILYDKDYKTEYVSSVCSLNKGIIAKPVIEFRYDNILGKTFKEIFSTKLLVSKMKDISKKFNVDLSNYDENTLPEFLDLGLVSKDIREREFSNYIVSEFGNRLGMIFLTLKSENDENKKARKDWNDLHWQYWKNIKNVILVGGLASGLIGRRFKEQIYSLFDKAGVEPYDITLFENGTYVGVQGCAKHLMKNDQTCLVCDFGHTNIKRCIVEKRNDRIVSCVPLDSLKSLYMNNEYDLEDNKRREAILLHKSLVRLLSVSYKEKAETYNLSDEIIISIANYTVRGKLNSVRGGYAKLSLLSDDYEKLLSRDVSSELHKNISIKLVHDGTANALYFSDIENSVCVSLGTSIGVGFPNIHIYCE